MAVIALFSANITALRAADPVIVINAIPAMGQSGYAEGKIAWDNLNSTNAGQYAVIAMLHAVWQGGGGYYVKPTYASYLNAVDANGNFSIQITTGGNDPNVDEVIFYFVEQANFNGIDGSSLNPATMTGKYLTTTTIYRSTWVQPPQPLASNIRPGLVAVGTEITLSCQEGGTIYYTLDGSDPKTSATAQTYTGNVFTVPASGALIVKGAVKISDSYSPVSSLVWLPQEPLNTSFWGLCTSLALNGEKFGYPLSEATTRERMIPVSRMTKWVRTFGTINNGQEYINRIAKDLGLHTLIGLYITTDATNNNAQIEGLRQILQTSPAPDLIAIGNETSLSGVSQATVASCIDAVREMVIEQGLVIPIGSVDIANITWSQTILEKLDFIGVNIYSGTWDNTPENQMLGALKQTYANTISAFPSKLILLTETGTPYSGGSYSFAGGSQTASETKAANYLCGFLDWIKQDNIPAFYFEAYDEPVKSQNGGQAIEQYFGVMDGTMQIHPFFNNCLSFTTANPKVSVTNLKLYPNPFSDMLHLAGAAGSLLKILTEDGKTIYRQKIIYSDEIIQLKRLPAGVYFFHIEKDGKTETVKALKE